MPAIDGRWVFTYLDLIGPLERGRVEKVRRELTGRTVTEAVREATDIWREAYGSSGRSGWDKIVYPREPILTFEIDWAQAIRPHTRARSNA